ncbi:hypothetical protein RIR_jg40675.t1 [Rhizophagus irregularis DAOM 181602=DAOM 197198]|nr:hypothetical protein RIR_jg40675.t1 [Rhizophagus irregularis DAOM 181602=DAOM 197198]
MCSINAKNRAPDMCARFSALILHILGTYLIHICYPIYWFLTSDTRSFNENEFESENENVINTEGFGLSQNSDSNNSLNIENSDNESEISDLFQENTLLNMATEAQMRRIVENV